MKQLYIRALLAILFIAFSHQFVQSQVVINEVYGGGNNSGAPFRNDFVELYNPSTAEVAVGGWKVEYFSATGGSGGSVLLPAGATVQPGGYYLLQLAGGTTNGVALPTPDATGSMNMSATNGRVDLTNASATLMDRAGFGTANLFEGTAAAPAANNTNSIQRDPAGADTDNNNVDFKTGAPTPRNSSPVIIKKF